MAINKTKVGLFAVDFRDQFHKQPRKTFETYRETVAYEKEVKAQVQRGEYIRPSNDTVKEIAEKWHQRKVQLAPTSERASNNGETTFKDLSPLILEI